MKIECFKYHEKFCVKSAFLDTSIDVEGTLDPGETLPEAVAKAREEILKSLPKQESLTKYAGDVAGISLYTSGSIPTISKDFEKLEIAIDNAQTVESLKEIKASNPLMPASLMSSYNLKMYDLVNKPVEFTDGLS